MTCASCAVAVKTALRKLDGVKSVDVDLEKKQAGIAYDGTKTVPLNFIEAISQLGYRAGTPVKQQ